MATHKTRYLQMFYNSIVYNNPYPSAIDCIDWSRFSLLRELTEKELLPLLREHPEIFAALSGDVQELILECFMPEFISAILNITAPPPLTISPIKFSYTAARWPEDIAEQVHRLYYNKFW
jgi:hypothetical protein